MSTLDRATASTLSALMSALLSTAIVCGCTTATPAPTPTTVPPVATATPPATASPSPLPSPSPTPTVTPETEGSAGGVVVARSEGSGTFAIASLTGISLQGGHEYVLRVTSEAGPVSFFGSYSASAMGGNGQPGVQVDLLEGTTPAVYPIAPPVADPRDWLYAVSVQNRDSGGIIVTILDVGESQEPAGSGLPSRQKQEPMAACRLERNRDSAHIRG